jgi:alkylation response protein AidB-like acyl-CoA dehydrogenase
MARDLPWVAIEVLGPVGPPLASWGDVERRAVLALSSELVGVAQRILDVAVAQVSTREQFGRPIGTYQAVRFRMAEAYADIVGARGLVSAAWRDGSDESASWAKAVSGGAFDAVAKHAMQVCGAIGLSEEHQLPGLVRRGFCLDALLSGSAADPTAVGRRLLAAGSRPDGRRTVPVAAF